MHHVKTIFIVCCRSGAQINRVLRVPLTAPRAPIYIDDWLKSSTYQNRHSINQPITHSFN